MNKVAIFGTGPAGLAAAHAAYLSGYWVVLFSYGFKSQLHGCQYLHQFLPELSADIMKTDVRYQLWGTAEDYRDKVYGDLWAGKVSPEDLTGEHEAWDIRAAYDRLWSLYMDGKGRASHYEQRIDSHWLRNYYDVMCRDFDRIISTIPIKSICTSPASHTFLGNEVWAIGDSLDKSQLSPVTAPSDTIICNGLESPSWYRASSVFGMATAEWPGNVRPPIPGMARVIKPLYTDCDCWSEIHRMGRYGAWKKGALVHDVFNETMELLSK